MTTQMLPGKIREEYYQITDSESGVTATDISANQTSLWLEGWRYQVPVGFNYVFKREHIFSAYLKDLAAAEFADTAKVRILVKDPSQNDAKVILQPTLYAQVKEWQQDSKLKHLDLTDYYVAKENYWIVIECYCTVSLDASECYWALACGRIRPAIF